MVVTLLGWLTDIIRIVWGLFFWNVRKTIFRVRRKKAICPCQIRSDSGLAGQTGCEPSLLFDKPSRFRHVCPLLKSNEKGELKCTVNTEDVRPFWGRFFLIYGGTFLLCYLLCVGAIFGAMRYIGYPINFSTLAWPPAWEEVDDVRSKYFIEEAEAAFAVGDRSSALMALSLAYTYAPENYDVGRLLAQFWASSRPQHSDQIYEELLERHPEKRTATAQAWVKGLLARGDFVRLEELAADALIFDPESSAAWLQSFVFANTRTRNNAILEDLLSVSNSLPSGIRRIFELEIIVRTESLNRAKEALSDIDERAEPVFLLHYRIQRLIQLGQHHRALLLLNKTSDRFPNRDRIRLELAAYANGDFSDKYLELIRSLARLVPSLPQIELLSSHLIASPNSQIYTLVKQTVNPRDIFAEKERIQCLNSFFIMAVVHQDQVEQDLILSEIKQLTGGDPMALIALQTVATEPSRYRIQNILPVIQPLSFDMIYSAHIWYESIEK